MEYLEGSKIKIDKPKNPKKITGTRLAAIMGLNPYNTPFKAWCEITRLYEEPFEDNKYTLAGKVIEPLIIDYLNKTYFLDLKTPADRFGEDYFSTMWGDFFPETDVFGGMWDAIDKDTVVEIKTASNAKNWSEDIPIHYKLQVALYAYLLKVDNVMLVVSFLNDVDYNIPENFKPSVENTKVYTFKMSEEFPTFEKDYIAPALLFYSNLVMEGISPEYDEEKDKDIIDALFKFKINDKKDIRKLLTRADNLQQKIDKAKDKIKENEKELKEINDVIKAHMVSKFREGDKNVEMFSKKYKWVVSKSNRITTDTKALKNDGLFDKYSKTNTSYTLRKTPIRKEI